MDTEFKLKRQKSKEKELTRLFQCLGLQYTGFFILTCHKLITWFELSTVKFYRNDRSEGKQKLLRVSGKLDLSRV